MKAKARKRARTWSLTDAVRDSISVYLDEQAKDDGSSLSGLDRWTQRRVILEMLAKTDLVFQSGNPVEHCYQNLVREIDIEAETGVLLANDAVGPAALRKMCEDPGVSGELYQHMERIAPEMFPDDFEHSKDDLDLVWASVQARYDRASLEAEVSERVMTFLMDSADSARDMTNALRSMFYSFHEEGVRRQFDLPSLLDDPETRDLFVMVAELMKRAGSYENRIDAIQRQAGTA
jgi:hypothetical protein